MYTGRIMGEIGCWCLHSKLSVARCISGIVRLSVSLLTHAGVDIGGISLGVSRELRRLLKMGVGLLVPLAVEDAADEHILVARDR